MIVRNIFDCFMPTLTLFLLSLYLYSCRVDATNVNSLIFEDGPLGIRSLLEDVEPAPPGEEGTKGVLRGEPNDHEKGHLLDLTSETAPQSINTGFIHAFVASLTMIIVSELGDKTFFVAAILSMRHSRLSVYFGAMTAMIVMTVLSAFMGWVVTIVPRYVTHYVSVVLFLGFGVKLLRDAWTMSPDEAQEEYEEVQAEIKKKEEEMLEEVKNTTQEDVETGVITSTARRRRLNFLFSAVFVESFTLCFVGEWGDRSQIATIVLAAREDTYFDIMGVVFGGILGHSFCTGLAVLGGRIISQKISARTVTFIGGIVFILFGFSAYFFGD